MIVDVDAGLAVAFTERGTLRWSSAPLRITRAEALCRAHDAAMRARARLAELEQIERMLRDPAILTDRP